MPNAAINYFLPAGQYPLLNYWATSDLRVLLLTTSYVFDPAHSWVTDVSGFELSVAGYSRQVLTGLAAVEDDANTRAILTGTSNTWDALAPGQTIGWAVVYRNTGSDGTSPLIGAWDVTSTPTNGGLFGLVWPYMLSAWGYEPDVPDQPNPGAGAQFLGLTPTLSWSTFAPATGYDVYFGVSSQPPLVSSGQTASTYTPGVLVIGTTYYWQIVSYSAQFPSGLNGPIWSFTIQAGQSGEDQVTVLTTNASGTLNDFNVGSLGTITVLRCTNNSLLTINGLSNGGSTPTDGQLLYLESLGTGQVDIANEQSGSAAANRMHNPVTGTISLAAGVGRALFVYDGGTSRWRCLEHEQGAAITPAFNAANFTPEGGGTDWTVTSGDVATFTYYLQGRQLTVTFDIRGTSVVAGHAILQIAIPGGFTNNVSFYAPALYYVDNGGTPTQGWLNFVASGTAIYLSKQTGTWSASTNATDVKGEIVFEVQ